MNGILHRVSLFATLPQNELRRLEEVMRPVTLAQGAILFWENEMGAGFFVLAEGTLEVWKALDTEDQRLLVVLHPGDVVGELSLLDGLGRRAASVRARTNAHLLEMTLQDLEALLVRQPSMALEIARALNIRLRQTNTDTIRDLQEKNRQLAHAYQELKAAQAQLIEKERMERELQLAKQIQEDILPKERPLLPPFTFGATILPARAVGGDLFDFIPLDAGRMGVIIGDVSDKGVPAAIFMALARSLVRAEARHNHSPAKVLADINQLLLEMSNGAMFVTLLFGVLEVTSRRFSYARAGHELPLLFDRNRQRLPIPVGKGQPLGIFSEVLLDSQMVEIPCGGLLLLTTDGVTDATNRSGESFGSQRLQAAVEATAGLPAQEICAHLVQVVQAFQGNISQYDDISLVTICCA